MNIEDHGRGAFFFTQPVGSDFLKIAVDRQAEIFTGLAFLAGQFADHTTDGIDLDLAVASLAAKVQIENALNTVFADLESGQFKQRIPGYFLFGNRRYIPQDMGKIGSVRILSALADFDRKARQIGCVHLNLRNIPPFEILPAQTPGGGELRGECAGVRDLPAG